LAFPGVSRRREKKKRLRRDAALWERLGNAEL